MRTRPNQLMIPQRTSRIPNTIYRRYRRAWQILLDQRGGPGKTDQSQDVFFKDSYIEMPTAHQELYDAVTGYRDSIFCLLGYTGVGKSTVLRHLFGFQNDNPDIRRAPPIPEEELQSGTQNHEHRVLYIPIFMNGRLIEQTPGEDVLMAVSNHFASQISAACRRLFEDSKIQYDENLLADFIASQQRDLLERDASQPIEADKIARLGGLRKVYRFGFEMMLLKWLLLKSNIQRVILIVDDVEALSLENQDAICHVIAQSFEWLRSLRGLEKSWFSNAIISLRPLTYNMLQKTDWYRALFFDDPIGLDSPADLKLLFEKRFKTVLERFSSEQDSPEKKQNWQSALTVFEHVYGRLASIHKNFLVRLCNFSIRRALVEFENLLLNRRYFEPDVDPNNPTKLVAGRLNFTESAALRALGMGDGNVFPLADGQISNIFLNRVNPESDLLGLLALLALLHTGRKVKYGLNYLERPELLSLVDTVCCLTQPEQESLRELLPELRNQGLLEIFVSPNPLPGRPDREIVEFMPKAQVLWQALSTSSILTEMFRDDTFVDYHETEAKELKCTQEFENDAKRIQASIDFAYKLVLIERNFIERCINNGPGIAQWSGTFGPVCIGRAMLSGIERSIDMLSTSGGIKPGTFGRLGDYKLALGLAEQSLRRVSHQSATSFSR